MRTLSPVIARSETTKQSGPPSAEALGLPRSHCDANETHQRRQNARTSRIKLAEDPMNIRSNPEKTVPAVTTGPLPSSRKIFASPDAAPDIRVPLREIILSEGAGEPNLPVYDTSGPYTDPSVTIDVNAGLARGRKAWVLERGGVEEYQGRQIKPEDNGSVSTDKAARAFSAGDRPRRRARPCRWRRCHCPPA